MFLMMGIAEQIKMVRKWRKVKQYELAEMCDCHKETISRIERGISNPSPSILKRIAEALDYSFDKKEENDV